MSSLGERLCCFFKALAEGEQLIELQRIELAKNYLFSPKGAFKALDVNGTGQLMPCDLQVLLGKDSEGGPEHALYLLVKQYSSCANGKLEYSDFISFTTPRTKPYLAQIAVDRAPSGCKLPFEVEFRVTRLVAAEVALQGELDALKGELSKTQGYSPYKAFTLLNRGRKDCIDANDLVQFSAKHRVYLSPQGAEAAIRRFETKDIEGIDLKDFVDYTFPVLSRKHSLDSPVKGSEQPEPPQVPPKKLFSSAAVTGLEELLAQQLLCERTLEFYRQNLALTESFSCPAVLALCAREDPEFIYISEFEGLLTQLGVESNRDDIWTIYNRYAVLADNSPVLDQSCLKALLAPQDPEYSSKLEHRGLTELSGPAQESLAELLSYLIESEKQLNALKEELSGLTGVFKEVNISGSGDISPVEMRNALATAGLDPPNKDLEALLRRYSPLNKVSLSAFLAELGVNN